jgi:hypothetical protein
MKNIYIIPTDKTGNKRFFHVTNDLLEMQWQHIYITNDEEIKEGDWFYFPIEIIENEKGHKYVSNDWSKFSDILYSLYAKKIILTTDGNLIKDGIQAIDNEFLEWVFKNPKCDFVEVKPLLSNNGRAFYGYKIITPEEPISFESFDKEKSEAITKEGQKVVRELQSIIQEETLKEVAKVEPQQEKRYSEEDVKKIAFDFYYDMSHKLGVPEYLITENATNVDVWFKKFKKSV